MNSKSISLSMLFVDYSVSINRYTQNLATPYVFVKCFPPGFIHPTFLSGSCKHLHHVFFSLLPILTSLDHPKWRESDIYLPFPFWVPPLPQSRRARSLASFVAVLCTGPSVFWFSVFWDWAPSSRTVGPWTVQHWRSTGYSQTWISWFPESESTGIYRDTRSSSKVKKRGVILKCK